MNACTRRFAAAVRCIVTMAAWLAFFAASTAARATTENSPPVASEPSPGGIRPGALELVGGPRGRALELVADPNGGYIARFEIKNDGPGAIDIGRITARGSGPDRRAPGVEATFEGGRPNAHLAENATRAVIVHFKPDIGFRARQVYALVLVEPSTPGVHTVAIGVHARLPTPAPWLTGHLLSLILFLPLAGFFVIAGAAAFRNDAGRSARWLLLGITCAEVALAAWLYGHFDPAFGRLDGNDGYQFVERAVWIRSLGVEYFVGADGFSAGMVLLTALVACAAALASFSVQRAFTGYAALFCLLITGVMGVFVALDALLFCFFWQLLLLPTYFLVGLWGGARKEHAAIKAFLFTLLGSVLMLLAFVTLHHASDPAYLVDGTPVAHTFSLPELARTDFANKPGTLGGLSLAKACWVALFIAFAIETPMFPLHTWATDAHVEAPTAISMVLAGVMLAMGPYGMLRINFALLPRASVWGAPAMAAFGAIDIVYASFCALAQRDLKRLVAYSSLGQMGYCLLAMASLTPAGIEGCLVQTFNHGTIAAMLFALVGVLADRAGTRQIDRFGGLAQTMPVFATLAGLAFMASLGLPGLSGFVGQLLALVGAFPVYRGLTALAAFGMVLAAAYHLSALQRILFGPVREAGRTAGALAAQVGSFPDIHLREAATLAPLGALVIVLGVFPSPLLRLFDRSAADLSNLVSPPGPTRIAVLDPAPNSRCANRGANQETIHANYGTVAK